MGKLQNIWNNKNKENNEMAFNDYILKGIRIHRWNARRSIQKWRHKHKFHNIIDGKQTEIIDEIEFELPYGILEKLFKCYAYKQLQNIFEYRKIATVKALE